MAEHRYAPDVPARTRPRNVIFWCVAGAGIAGFILLGVSVVLLAALSTPVRVTNDSDEPIRLSGCSIDDALDLDPGATGTVDVIGHEGCNAYDERDFHYIGCVVLTDQLTETPVRRTLQPALTQHQCDRIGKGELGIGHFKAH